MAAVDSFELLYRELSRSCSPYFETLALVGALYTVSRAVILLRDCCTLVRVHFLPRMIPSKRLTQRFGDWAVIYGKDAAAGGHSRNNERESTCAMRFILVRFGHQTNSITKLGLLSSLESKQSVNQLMDGCFEAFVMLLFSSSQLYILISP